MPAHGKKYLEATKAVEADSRYLPKEAVELAKKTAYTKFDGTIELHLRLAVDPKNAEQQVRGVALLPHGVGKTVRVLVFCQGEDVRTVQAAGADYVADDDLIKKIEGGWVDFDVAIATPDMMGKVSRLGRVLGRRGLMPNPKSGTVVPGGDLARAVSDARKGRVEFRMDKSGLIHTVVGKASFEPDKLLQNLASVMDAVMQAKPASIKGQFVQSATLNATMGPGVHMDVGAVSSLKPE